MRPEVREVVLWGGVAGVAVIVLWIYLAVRGSGLAEDAARLDQEHDTYQALYLAEDGDRRPAAETMAAMGQRLAEQRRHLERSESRSVWPGQGGQGLPPEFAGIALGASAGTPIDDYTTALDLVSRITGRLRQRAESLGMTLPAVLPLEQQGELSPDSQSERALQLVRVCAYAALLDLAMDADVEGVGPLAVDGRPWRDARSTYAAVPVGTVLTCSYASADLIMRRLADNSFGLGLEGLTLSYTDSGDYRLAVTVRLLVPYRDDWQLEERAASGATTTAEAGRTRSSGGRGSGR